MYRERSFFESADKAGLCKQTPNYFLSFPVVLYNNAVSVMADKKE